MTVDVGYGLTNGDFRKQGNLSLPRKQHKSKFELLDFGTKTLNT